MLLLILTSLWASPCVTSLLPHQDYLEILMDNVVYLQVPHNQNTRVQVPLTCGQSYQDQAVFWKKDGKEVEPALRGSSVSVVVEEMDGGNYTCHSGSDGRVLNHTLVLVKLESDNHRVILEKPPTGGPIHCSAPNYKGAFHCKWKRMRSRSSASVLQVKVQRNRTTIPCTLLADGSGVHCQDSSCPHVEEQHHISITVHIRSHARLEEYSKQFFLRDIVRPDKLQNLRSSEESLFSWDLPDTWAQPCSFYSLEFEVKVVDDDRHCSGEGHTLGSITDERQFKVDLESKGYIFCVRARDKFTSGPWSHWSHCAVPENQMKTC
ncbi:interleukin-12 subunit beta [Neosynchiropus ocellatus]